MRNTLLLQSAKALAYCVTERLLIRPALNTHLKNHDPANHKIYKDLELETERREWLAAYAMDPVKGKNVGMNTNVKKTHKRTFNVTADSKVLDFLRLLEEYRRKCEEQGNYAEARKSRSKFDELLKKEVLVNESPQSLTGLSGVKSSELLKQRTNIAMKLAADQSFFSGEDWMMTIPGYARDVTAD